MKSFLLGMFLVLFSLGTLACAENNKTGEEKFLLLSGKNKQKALYLFIHRHCSRFTHPGAWFSVSNCKYYKMHLF